MHNLNMYIDDLKGNSKATLVALRTLAAYIAENSYFEHHNNRTQLWAIGHHICHRLQANERALAHDYWAAYFPQIHNNNAHENLSLSGLMEWRRQHATEYVNDLLNNTHQTREMIIGLADELDALTGDYLELIGLLRRLYRVEALCETENLWDDVGRFKTSRASVDLHPRFGEEQSNWRIVQKTTQLMLRWDDEEHDWHLESEQGCGLVHIEQMLPVLIASLIPSLDDLIERGHYDGLWKQVNAIISS